jgi:hypothetical protein
MFVDRVDIRIESASGSNDVAETLSQLCSSSPFALHSVTAAWTGVHDCSFQTKREGLAVGYASIIELQHRVHRSYDIVSVDRITNSPTFGRLVMVG